MRGAYKQNTHIHTYNKMFVSTYTIVQQTLHSHTVHFTLATSPHPTFYQCLDSGDGDVKDDAYFVLTCLILILKVHYCKCNFSHL